MAQSYAPEAGNELNFKNIPYELYDTKANCSEMAYVCTEFKRGDGGEFEFEAYPDESALIGCTRVRTCEEAEEEMPQE